jgi:Holliday junction resolvase
MAINSRTKGNKNERDLAKLFEKWSNHKFSRTPSSGGLQWKASNSKGDIVCTDEGYYFPFCIEAKNYKDINFEHLLYLPKPKILEFWEQAKRDADKAKKIPILTMRYNGMPKDLHFVVVEAKFAMLLFETEIIDPSLYLKFMSKKHKLAIFNSKDFFSMPYKSVAKLAKKEIGYGKKK